jgi:hypothetical protein
MPVPGLVWQSAATWRGLAAPPGSAPSPSARRDISRGPVAQGKQRGLTLDGAERTLDVGCGDGKITTSFRVIASSGAWSSTLGGAKVRRCFTMTQVQPRPRRGEDRDLFRQLIPASIAD